MNRPTAAVLCCLLTSFAASVRATQVTTAPTTAPATNPTDQLDRLRTELETAYNREDLDGMLRLLHPDAIIIFPDGRFLHGREGLRDYFNKMLKSPDHVVAHFSANPDVKSRTIHGDVGLSYGLMNDSYELTDGRKFALDSRFTVTLIRSPDGPPDTGGWMIRSFHASTDAFDNPLLATAARHGGQWGAVIGFVVGVVIGIMVWQWRTARQRSREGRG